MRSPTSLRESRVYGPENFRLPVQMPSLLEKSTGSRQPALVRAPEITLDAIGNFPRHSIAVEIQQHECRTFPAVDYFTPSAGDATAVSS